MKKTSEIWIAVIIVLSILCVWVITPMILSWQIETPERRGLFGDSFGALNSLFSGLAFAGVIIAILLQRNELKLQRQELELTRNELTKSTEAQEKAGTYLGEQSEVMKVTAELNGRAALIQARTEQISYLNSERENGVLGLSSKIANLDQERSRDIRELEELMHAVLCASEH